MTREQILEEIGRLPEEKLAEVYQLLQQLDLSIADRKSKESIMSFAGSWQDMSEKHFQALSAEIAQRRRQAFSRRRGDAGITP